MHPMARGAAGYVGLEMNPADEGRWAPLLRRLEAVPEDGQAPIDFTEPVAQVGGFLPQGD